MRPLGIDNVNQSHVFVKVRQLTVLLEGGREAESTRYND
jgi:hypothetical protein